MTTFKSGKKFPFGTDCPCAEVGTDGTKKHTLYKGTGKRFKVKTGKLHIWSCPNHLPNYVSGGFKVIGRGELV